MNPHPLPTFDAEWLKCYACQFVWFGLWPDDQADETLRPHCPRCRSRETFTVVDATPFEQATNN